MFGLDRVWFVLLVSSVCKSILAGLFDDAGEELPSVRKARELDHELEAFRRTVLREEQKQVSGRSR